MLCTHSMCRRHRRRSWCCCCRCWFCPVCWCCHSRGGCGYGCGCEWSGQSAETVARSGGSREDGKLSWVLNSLPSCRGNCIRAPELKLELPSPFGRQSRGTGCIGGHWLARWWRRRWCEAIAESILASSSAFTVISCWNIAFWSFPIWFALRFLIEKEKRLGQ